MRKLCFLLLIVSVWSCSRAFQISDYNETQDKFRGVNRFTFEESLRPEEKRPSVSSVRNFYLNEVDATGRSVVSLYIILIKNQLDFYTEDTCYIATDGQLMRKVIKTKETEHFTTISESTSNILKADSSTVSVIDSYSQNNYVQNRFKLEFTTEEIDLILQTNALSFRYYGGGKTSTFLVPGANLEKIKRVLKK